MLLTKDCSFDAILARCASILGCCACQGCTLGCNGGYRSCSGCSTGDHNKSSAKSGTELGNVGAMVGVELVVTYSPGRHSANESNAHALLCLYVFKSITPDNLHLNSMKQYHAFSKAEETEALRK